MPGNSKGDRIGESATWYDKRARETQFEVGDKVLVLLPTRTEKLLPKWKGPYNVIRKVGKVNYELEIMDERKGRKLFHVNMLNKWNEPEEMFMNQISDKQEEVPCYQKEQQNIQDAVYREQLTKKQKEKVEQLIKKFPQVIQARNSVTTQVRHRINTTDPQPIRQRSYRIPPAIKRDIIKELQEMKDDRIVEELTSEWVSQLVIVKKKDGSNRICVDYRRLKAKTKFDAYPMPRINDLLDYIGQSKYLTMLDLMKGNWQVQMDERDKEKTAFTSLLELLQFATMPFGLSGGPATFQRLMDHVLRGTEEYAGVYLDDIIVYGTDWEEHLKNLEGVFKRLCGAGLTIKLKKCTFGEQECTYLGHKIGNGGVLPEDAKVQAIRKRAKPRTKKEVRSFLGMLGYYRRFILHFATKAEPLTNLTKKGQPDQVTWTSWEAEAFELLKKYLIDAVMLKNQDFSK